ncbi:MAG: lysophospholipid acyltransferase family protein [Alphaproteobacteria bacterium]
MQMARHIQAGFRLGVFLLFTMICMPVYSFSRSPGQQRRVAEFWFRSVNHIVGLKLRAYGYVHRDGPVLYVANHVSYLDILVLGAMVDAVFVAKHDVAGWPLFGRLARMRQCVFVTRKAAQVRSEVEMIRAQLDAGRNVILFPEGTTGCGGKLLPFKSALLAAVEGLPQVRVQPVSIAYPDLARGGADTSLAWYGEMAMLPHLWSVLGRGNAPARMQFHPPLTAEEFPGRKALADACRAHITGGMGMLLAPAHVSGADNQTDENSVWDQPSLGQHAAY